MIKKLFKTFSVWEKRKKKHGICTCSSPQNKFILYRLYGIFYSQAREQSEKNITKGKKGDDISGSVICCNTKRLSILPVSSL
jgi:hypothetical protein